jgi:hypothetical protein
MDKIVERVSFEFSKIHLSFHFVKVAEQFIQNDRQIKSDPKIHILLAKFIRQAGKDSNK